MQAKEGTKAKDQSKREAKLEQAGNLGPVILSLMFNGSVAKWKVSL